VEKTSNRMALALGAALLAACGSSSGSGTTSSSPAGGQLTRGAITARSASAITVNGVQLSTAGAAVRVDDHPGGVDDLQVGRVVTVKGAFDDRSGAAAEIEIEHEIEGRVEAKGVDFVVVGGQRVQIDDSTAFGEDNPLRLDSVFVGSVYGFSGVPVGPGGTDDKGGLRASRVDTSPRSGGAVADDDDLEVKGFVSSLSGTTFELRLSPDAIAYWVVDASGAGAVAGLADGAYVEVHTLTAPAAGVPPRMGTLVASSIRVEDRFGQAEVEIEGYVTSLSAAKDSFLVDGVAVRTAPATRFELGVQADLVAGVKVEVEGTLDGQGVLAASRVSFRAGARITAVIEGYTGTDMVLLGVPVQIPSWTREDVAPANGVKVEVRGMPSADGTGLVAQRIGSPSGNAARLFIRAVATAKSDAGGLSFTVLGFTVTPAPGATLKLTSGSTGDPPAAFFAAVEAGRTVLKVRADSIAAVNVGSRTWSADEIEIEGHE
jgi:hypothetical protein